MSRAHEVGASFGAAAATYESAATLQRLVADRLAARIDADLSAGPAPARILELGCGTGLLTRALRARFPDAWIVATDLSPGMLHACRSAMATDPRLQTLAMDAARPAVQPGFDLVCSSLALQWLPDPAACLAGLSGLLAPGGRLHVATLAAGSLAEWRAAHAAEQLADGGLHYPAPDELAQAAGGFWAAETITVIHPSGLDFLRALRRIGAHRPAPGHRPLGPGRMRRVLRRFAADHGSAASYCVAYGRIRRATRSGVFVTGTGTDIGKTLVATCLVRAWDAEYWKPLQTGLDAGPGDTSTVQRLSGCGAERLHPPAMALRAPLSPEAAALLEHRAIDTTRLALPQSQTPGRPLVVEGAGGVMVPIGGGRLMTGLMQQLGLPVILVAGSGLGTINHTLLSLQALRACGITIAGVVLSGPPSPGNRSAIERHGRVTVLAELPHQDPLDAAAVARLASLLPTPGAIGLDQ